MKKILPVFLAASLLLAACGSKADSGAAESTETTAETTAEQEETTKAETTVAETEESKAGFEAVYVGDGSLPIIEIDGTRYFDYSAEEFLKQLNAKTKEIMNEPATYEVSEALGDSSTVALVGDNDLICMLEMDFDKDKVVQIYVMAAQTEEYDLNKMALDVIPVMMLLDPNMDYKYAGAHLLDISLAAQLSLTTSASVYEGEHEGIKERIYGEDGFAIFNFLPATEETEEEEEASAPTGEKPDFGALSDDLYSFQIQINDDVYQLPMTYDQFTAFGWKYSGDALTTMSAGSYTSHEVFVNGKVKCYASITNFDVNTRPVNECYITTIKIDSQMNKDVEVVATLPGGVSLGGSYDEAIALYGTPGYEYDNETSRRTATYSLSSREEVKLGSVFEDRDVIGELEVEKQVKPADFVEGTVSTEVPDVVGKYKAPSKKSDEFGDFIFEYSGDLYQLPVPVSVFVDNGWKIIEDASDTTIAGKDFSWVTLMKDNQSLKTTVRNYDDNATAITNGFVTSVVSDVYSRKIPISLTKDISVGMERADVEKALADVEYEIKESGGSFEEFLIRPTDSGTNYYSISISKETGKVTSISVQYQPSVSEYLNR